MNTLLEIVKNLPVGRSLRAYRLNILPMAMEEKTSQGNCIISKSFFRLKT